MLGPEFGPCCGPDSNPGCETCDCTIAVCTLDSFCCDVVWDAECADLAQQTCAVCMLSIISANPPTSAENPYSPGQPFRDVLDTGGTIELTAGIGGDGTAEQGPVAYSPINVTFSGVPSPAPTAENVTIACTGEPCPTVTGVSGSGAGPYALTLSGPIPPGQCTTLTFASTAPGTKLQYQSLPGDVSLSGMTNTQDLLALIQALNNGAANLAENLARYNVNRSAGVPNPVNTQDLLRLVQLLNGTSTTQIFNGVGIAACP